MKKQIIAMVLASLTLATGWAGPTDDSERQKLKELLDENKNLVVQFAKVRKVQKQIASSEVALSGAQAALTGAQEDLKRRAIGLREEQQKTEEEGRRAGCPWGGSSADAGFRQACNVEADKLNTRLRDIQTKTGSLKEYAQVLQDEQRALSNKTVTVSKQKKMNNSDLDLLNIAAEDWQQRYNALVFHSEAYEQLKRTESGSRVCEQLSRPMTDAALQAAAQCLQRLWDRAR